ncbi:hypothetical protein PMAYCL1PPCAC_08734 [Pristionchus mayeri]|uniref:Nose resistant-to-fluoxetine protein N-terminal domain-containing protein n=1 Tax=Pristionchus mayeri TaxID=1317129 RepID=A0AAN5CDD2_9BILA|nr:hypothetical protein PMAYCL1PPCAC_08734 [Pristionchus mayeri]
MVRLPLLLFGAAAAVAAQPRLPFNMSELLNIPGLSQLPPGFSSFSSPLLRFDPSEIIDSVSRDCGMDLQQWLQDAVDLGRATEDCTRNGLNGKSCSHAAAQTLKEKNYALMMLLSTGRPASLPDLSLAWWGNYPQCKAAKAPDFTTSYCFVHLSVDFRTIGGALVEGLKEKLPAMGTEKCSPNTPENLKLALCLPASCAKDQPRLYSLLSDRTGDALHVCSLECAGPKKDKDWFFWIVNCALLFLIALTIFVSAIDYMAERRETRQQERAMSRNMDRRGDEDIRSSTMWKYIGPFSFYTNASRIFAPHTNATIRCLAPIRTITIVWIIMGHSMLQEADADNPLRFLDALDSFWNTIIFNAYAAVDTFFLFTGLVLTYVFFRKIDAHPALLRDTTMWAMGYFHRFLRLTPAYIGFVLFVMAWLPQLHGPFTSGSFTNTTYMVENCEKKIWMNLLYINNFDGMLESCYGISWFLATDMQLFWISPLFLAAFIYSGLAGALVSLLAIVLSVAAGFYFHIHYDLPATSMTRKSIYSPDFNKYVYNKPWARLSPFLIGVLLGYVIFRTRMGKLNIRRYFNPFVSIACWAASFAAAFAVIFGLHDNITGAVDLTSVERACYFHLGKIGWALAVGWVILACELDVAGPIKPFLEHNAWAPFGRLTFCAYLVHWFVIHYFYDRMDRSAHFVSIWKSMLSSGIPVTVLSFIAAFFWSALVEAPCIQLEKNLLMERDDEGKRSPEPTLMTYYPSPVHRDDKIPAKTLDVQTINVQFFDDEEPAITRSVANTMSSAQTDSMRRYKEFQRRIMAFDDTTSSPKQRQLSRM